MAKTRSRPRKSRASARAKGARKGARKKTSSAKRTKVSARPKPRSPEVLDLKTLRQQIDKAVSAMARRLTMTAQPSANLSAAQATLTRWASEIDEICEDPETGPCGPSMVIEL